jgi:hypothetical protein
MDGKHKKFDKSLYLEYDSLACSTVCTELGKQGLFASRNKDKYGPDIVVYSGLTPMYYVEAEVKAVWKATQDYFPWTEINIPERKGKFMRMRKPLEFWIFREDMARAVIIDGTYASKCPKVEVSNKYNSSGELFYKVPVVECTVHLLGEPYIRKAT